ncbi:hypothetical protein VTI74DRAFT_10512 [Chaetomium olivicolor]
MCASFGTPPMLLDEQLSACASSVCFDPSPVSPSSSPTARLSISGLLECLNPRLASRCHIHKDRASDQKPWSPGACHSLDHLQLGACQPRITISPWALRYRVYTYSCPYLPLGSLSLLVLLSSSFVLLPKAKRRTLLAPLSLVTEVILRVLHEQLPSRFRRFW